MTFIMNLLNHFMTSTGTDVFVPNINSPTKFDPKPDLKSDLKIDF